MSVEPGKTRTRNQIFLKKLEIKFRSPLQLNEQLVHRMMNSQFKGRMSPYLTVWQWCLTFLKKIVAPGVEKLLSSSYLF